MSTPSAGWRKERSEPSLSDVFRSIAVPGGHSPLRRVLAFIGPGYLVAVGYMDPGNWATSLAGGAKYGYRLLFVALLSNIMAILLQALCARLAIGSGRDLAQACRDAFSPLLVIPLWLLAEAAIIATDLAEVIGTAIGLKLLFGLPLEIGVFVTGVDVFLILWLQKRGFRWIEGFVITLLAVIALCFFVQIVMARPDWGGVVRGFAPSTDIVTDPGMLYLALGILGATVMPHNLYLHSGIVQTRAYGADPAGKGEALRLATWDSTVALMLALAINASILILAAATFHASGNTEIVEIDQAHALLSPLLGGALAPTLFGIALLCSGLNAAVTATMSGQIVMEGFVALKVSPALRRLITRLLAILPAIGVILVYGASEAGKLLILSQVVLSFQLPFAIVPLVLFTANRSKMGDLTAPRWLTAVCAVIAVAIIGLNLNLLVSVWRGAPI
ncbi:Nramp family divalent metal transporter [Acuticoccus sp. M5D2P5]|uniref:Nramp family divalent metal transporter n=1 Tax=Acuticoccus kalidii TaxID=2910977 RepID=UPI001F17EF5F|nr:Nramp family divalent metal transporter [Acuticoccus kalidii]MCF3933086.1 Nramp family divalent metal transporter [Acuticoccus kalidii]